MGKKLSYIQSYCYNCPARREADIEGIAERELGDDIPVMTAVYKSNLIHLMNEIKLYPIAQTVHERCIKKEYDKHNKSMLSLCLFDFAEASGEEINLHNRS